MPNGEPDGSKGDPNGELKVEPKGDPKFELKGELNGEPKVELKGEPNWEPKGESNGELNGIELPNPPKPPNGLKELNGEENGLPKSVKPPINPGPVPENTEEEKLNGFPIELSKEPPPVIC